MFVFFTNNGLYLVTISLVTTGCTIEGGFFITTPEPTPTPTPYNAYVIQTGNTTCQGGICNINGGLGFTNIYMAPGDTFVYSTNVFSDAGLTTQFPDTNAINPGGSYPNLYYVVGGVLYIDCIKGSGC